MGQRRPTLDDSSLGTEPSDEVDSFLREVAHITPLERALKEPDRTGQELGHFRIEKEIGRGGMGIVYAGVDQRLGRRVALKLLPSELVRDAARRQRFLREARSASAVTHPGMAAVYDIGEVDDCLFIAMELVSGRTLRAILRECGKLSEDEALRVAADVARALGKAHEAGIVHRDVKPENVMLTPEGWVKVLDFGLAKLPASEEPPHDDAADRDGSVAGRIVGTPGYMSPEQKAGEPVSAATDVYALGVMLHEMLTGSRPALEEGPAPELGVSGELGRLIERCTSADPLARADSGSALASELDALRAAGRKKPRAGARYVASALALALILVVSAVVIYLRTRAPDAVPAPETALAAAASSATPVVHAPPSPSPSPAPALAPSTSKPAVHAARAPRKPAPAPRASFDPLAHQK